MSDELVLPSGWRFVDTPPPPPEVEVPVRPIEPRRPRPSALPGGWEFAETPLDALQAAAQEQDNPAEFMAGVANSEVYSRLFDIPAAEAYTLESDLTKRITGGRATTSATGFKFLSDSAERAWQGSTRGLLGWEMALRAGKQTPEQMEADIKALAEIEAKIPKLPEGFEPNIGQRITQALTGFAVPYVMAAPKGIAAGSALGLMFGGTVALFGAPAELLPAAGTAAHFATTGAAAGVGFTLGMTASIVEDLTKMQAGGLYLDLMASKDSEGNTFDPNFAKAAMFGFFGVGAALEIVGFDALLGTIPGIDKLMGEGLAAANKSVLKSVPQIMLKYAVKHGVFITKETAVEVSQDLAEIGSGEFAKFMHNKIRRTGFDMKDWAAISSTLKETAINSAIAFAIAGAPGHIAGASAEVQQQIGIKSQMPRPDAPEMEVAAEHIAEQATANDIEVTSLPEDFQEGSQEIPKSQNETPPPNKPRGAFPELTEAWDKAKAVFFRKRDPALYRAKIERAQIQQSVRESLGIKGYNQEARDLDEAMQLYIDSKRNPEQVEELYPGLSAEHKAAVDRSRNLSPEMIKVAERVSESDQAIGLEAKAADVISTTIENHTNRIWKQRTQGEGGRGFRTTSRHAKPRVFDTIVQGWSEGYELKVKGASNNLAILKEELIRTIANKKLMAEMLKVTDTEGNPLLTTDAKQAKALGYKKVDIAGFRKWQWVGQAEPRGEKPVVEGKKRVPIRGKRVLETEVAEVLEQQDLYAPSNVEENLTAIFQSAWSQRNPDTLRGKAINTVLKYNAIVKRWRLMTTLFHHRAYLNSYWLPTGHKQWADMNPVQAARAGLEAINNFTPELEGLVGGGLTFGLRNEWDEQLANEKGAIGEWLDRWNVTREVREKVSTFREWQESLLFDKWGPGLKVWAALHELQRQVKAYPEDSMESINKRVADLMNDDFGGLHLERMGRSASTQQLLRIVLLAPDWTESNVRSMVKTIASGTKQERQMYQMFWVRTILKGAAYTAAANFALAGGDWDEMMENYRIAWESGDMKWMDVDITPIYRLFGGEEDKHRYFGLFGHFKDPLKFILHPIRSARYKASPVIGTALDGFNGENWQGKRYTTLRELWESGKTVKWEWGSGALDLGQFPSFIMAQAIGNTPAQFQNLLMWLNGEEEGFDMVTRSLGLNISKEYRRRSIWQ